MSAYHSMEGEGRGGEREREQAQSKGTEGQREKKRGEGRECRRRIFHIRWSNRSGEEEWGEKKKETGKNHFFSFSSDCFHGTRRLFQAFPLVARRLDFPSVSVKLLTVSIPHEGSGAIRLQ